MRNILFKAKRKDNGEWVQGYYCPSPFNNFPCKPAIYEISTLNEWWRAIEIIPETLCEYTGIIDSEGNKIWENDIILRQDSTLFEIVEYSGQGFIPWRLKYCKVIGNIFDNPELIKE